MPVSGEATHAVGGHTWQGSVKNYKPDIRSPGGSSHAETAGQHGGLVAPVLPPNPNCRLAIRFGSVLHKPLRGGTANPSLSYSPP